jgi:hypothetical protein
MHFQSFALSIFDLIQAAPPIRLSFSRCGLVIRKLTLTVCSPTCKGLRPWPLPGPPRLESDILTNLVLLRCHQQSVAESRLYRVANNLDACCVLLQNHRKAVGADFGGVHFASPVWLVDVVIVLRNQTKVKNFVKIFFQSSK